MIFLVFSHQCWCETAWLHFKWLFLLHSKNMAFNLWFLICQIVSEFNALIVCYWSFECFSGCIFFTETFSSLTHSWSVFSLINSNHSRRDLLLVLIYHSDCIIYTRFVSWFLFQSVNLLASAEFGNMVLQSIRRIFMQRKMQCTCTRKRSCSDCKLWSFTN